MASGDEVGSNPFDRSSKKYLESAVFTEGSDLTRIGEWLRDCEFVLDVGAGTLHTAGYLSDDGTSRVVGIDPSLPMLREGRSRYESVRSVGGRSELLPFGASTFDGVVCRYAAHHFADPEPFFREVRRVLKPGGELVFQDLVIEREDELGERINEIATLRDPSHERYRSPAEWRRFLEATGYVVRDSEGFTLPLNYETWLERSDPPAEARETIESLFAVFPEDHRRRINLDGEGGGPTRFEYPVLMLRCVPE